MASPEAPPPLLLFRFMGLIMSMPPTAIRRLFTRLRALFSGGDPGQRLWKKF